VKVAVGLTLFVVAVGVLTTPEARTVQASGTAPVEVRNTPLPVTLSGLGQIAGTVGASQSGVWNVGITSLPAVQLAPGTVVAVEDTTGHPFAIELCTGCGGAHATTLPVGYRFVIEQVSGRCHTTLESQSLLSPRIEASLNGQVYRYYVNSQLHGHLQRVFNDQTRIYVDGGVPEGLSIDGLGNEGCEVTFSGELTALSQPFPQAP
jgi:hypothetical protein